MFRLRGSHCLPRTAPTPRTFQLLGCGQGEDSDPAVFFVFGQRKTLKKQKSWVIIFCSFSVFCWPCHAPSVAPYVRPVKSKSPIFVTQFKQESRGISQPSTNI